MPLPIGSGTAASGVHGAAHLRTSAAIPFPRLRGVNETVTLSAATLAARKIRLVRTHVNGTWTRVGTTSVWNCDLTSALSSLATRIAGAPAGTAFIIDPHTYPGLTWGSTCHADPPMWADIQFHKNAAESYWSQVAQWGNAYDEEIAGYDLLNEPTTPKRPNGTLLPPTLQSAADRPDTLYAAYANPFRDTMVTRWNLLATGTQQSTWNSWAWKNNGYPDLAVGDPDPRSLAGFWQRCIDAIRAHDMKHPILIHAQGAGGSGGTWTGTNTGTNPSTGTGIAQGGSYTAPSSNIYRWAWNLNDPANNLVYEFHFYERQEYQTQSGRGAYSYPGSIGTTTFDKPYLNSLIDKYVDDLKAHNAKGMCGEFGPRYNSSDGGTAYLSGAGQFTADMIEKFELEGLPWCRHTYTQGGGDFDASRNTEMMTALNAGWALNP